VGVSITCYQPLAHGKVADDPLLAEIGAAYGASPDQVSLAFLMRRNLCVIPSSAWTDRMQRNFDALNVTLSDSDMEKIAQLDRGERHIKPAWGPDWD
jgi:2,5-diketo-D-gluconate reductase B